MWDLRHEGLKAIFNGTISDLQTKISKNLISDQVGDIISIFRELDNQDKITSKSLRDLADQAKEVGELQLATTFSDWAREGENAQISMEKVYASILGSNTKGLGNVLDVIKTFNALDPKDKEKQEDFANAVARTNGNLGVYLKNIEAGNASLLGYTGSLIKTTAKTIGLTLATTALNTAISLGVSLIISGVIAGLNRAVNGLDEAIGKVDQLKSELSDSQSEWDTLNDKISETRRRIAELERINLPTLFEQAELDKLKEYNNELERQKRLLEYENNKKVAQYNQEAQEAYAVLTNTSLMDGALANVFGHIFDNSLASNITNIERYQRLLDGFEQVKEQFDNGELDPDEYQALEDKFTKQSEEYRTKLSAYRTRYTSILSGLNANDSANAEPIRILSDLIEKIDELYGDVSSHATTIEEIWNNSDYATTTDRLSELAKQGELTNETFNNTKGIEEFKAALEKINITDVDEIIRAINKEVTGVSPSFITGAKSVAELNEQLDNLKKETETSFSNQSALKSAFDKIQEGSSLSADEARKLVEIYPELATEFDKTVDGYTISAEALVNANENILQSTRDSIKEQISGYQEVIGKFNELKSISGMPESDRNKLLKSLGVSEEQVKSAQTEINGLTLTLGMLNTVLGESENANNMEELSKVSSTLASKAKTLSSAFAEQNENGRLSVETILSLIDNGYAAALMYDTETGAIRLNAEAYTQLAFAEIDEQIAALQAEKTTRIKNKVYEESMSAAAAAAHGEYDLAESFYEAARAAGASEEEIDAHIAALNELRSHIGEVTSGTYGSGGDTVDQAQKDFEDFMRNTQLLFDRGLITAEIYYSKLAEANANFYKDCTEHAEDYESNLTKIWEHEKDEWDKKAKAEKEDLSKQLDEGYITQQQYDDAIIDIAKRYYGADVVLPSIALGNIEIGKTEWAKDNYKSLLEEATGNDQDQFKEAFQKQLDELNKKLETGKKSVEEWRTEYQQLRDDWWGEGSKWYGTTFASDMFKEMTDELEDVDSLYDDWLESIKLRYGNSVDDMTEVARQWRDLNTALYGHGNNPKKFKENLKDIVDYEKSTVDKAYEDGLISARQYFADLIALWQDNDDLLGASTLDEWMQEGLDKRAEQEKTYWEQQKALAEDYYDKQIEELQKVQDEQEKANKAEELRLNLIKAEQDLVNAKKQRNVLLFENGIFRYDVNQDDVLSAEDAYAEALKALQENELQEQIDLLQEQRDEQVKIYDAIIDMIDRYISKTTQIAQSDSEMFNLIAGSVYGNEWRKLRNNEIAPEELTEEQKSVISPEWKSIFSGIGSTIDTIMQKVMEFTHQSGMSTETNTTTNVAQDAVDNAMSNVYNNSNVTNDSSVNVGDIHMTIQGGTSESMLNEFANKLSAAISAKVPRAAT